MFAAGAIGVQLLKAPDWQNNPNIELLADVNAQPPLGIEGIEATDKGKERSRQARLRRARHRRA